MRAAGSFFFYIPFFRRRSLLKSFDDVVFNLHPIDLAAGQKAVAPLLLPGEEVVAAFATVTAASSRWTSRASARR